MDDNFIHLRLSLQIFVGMRNSPKVADGVDLHASVVPILSIFSTSESENPSGLTRSIKKQINLLASLRNIEPDIQFSVL